MRFLQQEDQICHIVAGGLSGTSKETVKEGGYGQTDSSHSYVAQSPK